MGLNNRYPGFDMIVRALCVLALVLVGASHVFPQVPPVKSAAASFDRVDISDYIMPDGSLPYICSAFVEADGTKSETSATFGQDCPACRIVSSILLPDPATALRVREPYTRIAFPAAQLPVHSIDPVFDDTSPRGPPFLIG